MNFSLKKQLPRRTLLRGMGSAIALPFLDAMIPAFAPAAPTSKAPARMAFVYFPNGVQAGTWGPQSESAVSALPEALPRVLTPLADYRQDILILENLTCDGGRALHM